jgi:hypothetical protein
MTQKSLNLAKGLGKYWKAFDDKYLFGDGQFYLIMGKTIVRCFKVEGSQVPDMFLKEFPIAPYIYSMCFGIMLSSVHVYRCSKGRNSMLPNKKLLFWVALIVSLFLSDGPIKLAHYRKELNLGDTSSN